MNFFYVINYDNADSFELQMVLPVLDAEPLGNINEAPMQSGTLEVSDFAFYEGGVAKEITSVTLSDTGAMFVQMAADRVSDGYFIIKAFNPLLRGQSGSVSGGGVIAVTKL